MKGKVNKFVVIVSMMVGALATSMAARAEHVKAETPYFSGVPLQSLVRGSVGSSINNTEVVWGTSLSVSALAANSAGHVNVRLSDIGWPAPLKSLSLLVTDLNGLWKKVDGPTLPGGLTIDLAGPAKLFFAVFAKSEGKEMPGLYNLKADFAPVPLPAAAWLLLSGVGGLAAFRRKRLLDR